MKAASIFLFASTGLWSGAAVAQSASAPETLPASNIAPSSPTPPPVATPADVSGSGGDIVVTAQKRTERLLDVPISISVVDASQAQSQGVVGSRDLGTVTPGLIASQSGYTFQPSIRGISSTGFGAGDESNVALYVDNVYIAAEGATAFNLANIERVEVLKGPQGTLFGRNATGGAIRVVTSDPSHKQEFTATGSLGLDGAKSKELSVYANTGITDTLAANITGYYYNDDGYLKNADPDYDGKKQGSLKTWTVRGKVLWTPTDNFRVVAEGDYGKTRSGVELTTAFIDNINGFKNVTGVVPVTTNFTVATDEQNYDRSTNDGAYINAQYDADKFTITSISAYRDSQIAVSLDNDRTNLPINRNVYQVATKTFSEELNFASQFGGKFEMIGGLYYFHDRQGNPFFNTFAAKLSPVGPDGERTVTSPLAISSSLRDFVKDDSYAAFGEGTYHLTDTISLVGGVRYNYETKNAKTSNLLLPPGSPIVTGKGHWSNVSYRATVNWKPNQNLLFYFTNSTGFKSGVINAAAYTYPNPFAQVKPEKVMAFEFGSKAKLGPVSLTASTFYYDYKDIQLTVNNTLSANAGTVGINILENAAVAHIFGADFEAEGHITSHLSGNVGISWLPEAKYSSFPAGIHYVPAPGGLGAIAVASDISGSRILRSPKATENVGLTYDTDIANGDLKVSANYYHTSRFFMVVGEGSEQPSYSTLNFAVSWTDPSKHYTFGVFGRNATNKAYYISGLANTGGFSAVWAKPREIGLRFGVKY
jgi:iron complex outermembrane receptor protein